MRTAQGCRHARPLEFPRASFAVLGARETRAHSVHLTLLTLIMFISNKTYAYTYVYVRCKPQFKISKILIRNPVLTINYYIMVFTASSRYVSAWVSKATYALVQQQHDM
ncbi:hypothetical protein J3458_021520 [Metarhizium acridum]|uniref:uncharacterized protein n=1 Tax=Metarhizium acridum TaxID=92637 RepID=UPI001C6CB056|nr:hypothetical protein J3458_021436 [Metarhizium acridum]KAG8406193.1 hypothetical protein J3458_021520 [Metarhizium acridum]